MCFEKCREYLKAIRSGRSRMGRIGRNNNDLANHLIIGVFVNLISAGLLVGGHFVQRPILKVAVWAGAVLIWWVLAYFIKSHIRPNWGKVKRAGYYFLPTWPISWALEQRKRWREAEEEISRLKGIIERWPAAKTAQQIIDPVSRNKGLKDILDNMDNIPDRDLAMIIDRVRYYAGDIWESPENGENYILFSSLIENLSLYELNKHTQNKHTQTFESLLWLFSDIYEIQRAGKRRREVQNDMITYFKNVIWRTDEANLNVLRGIIEKIMLDSKDNHDLARPILEMLLSLELETQKFIWQLIFDECMKRAFNFPERFGLDFLRILNKLEHKVFWLDFYSLRNIWREHLTPGEKGLIVSQQPKFNELCSKVFAAIENPQRSGICNGRVFRRLSGKAGKVHVECILPNGKKCRCEGKSLSFRGIYSQDCIKRAGEKFKAKIEPLLEHNRQFGLTTTIANLHTDKNGNVVDGRGIFFDDADETAVKYLYQYISQH